MERAGVPASAVTGDVFASGKALDQFSRARRFIMFVGATRKGFFDLEMFLAVSRNAACLPPQQRQRPSGSRARKVMSPRLPIGVATT